MNERLRKATGILAVAGLAACAFLASEVAMPQSDLVRGLGKRLNAHQSTLPPSGKPVSHSRKIAASLGLGDTTAVEDTFTQIDACMTETMAAAEIPGAALALVEGGERVYERGYGVKHREQGGAVDAQTLFHIGSVQKMMTAAAVMRQAELGVVDLDESVTNLIPELQFAGPWQAGSITVSHLLTHTSAVPNLAKMKCDVTLSEWASSLEDVHLFAPPGSFYNYSNAGFSLAGLVAERASGVPYPDLMHDWIWEPAGMMATTLQPQKVIAYGNYTHGHKVNPQTGETVIIAPDDHECWWSAPAVGGFTTVGDLARWALLVMEGGGDVLAPPSVEAMQARQVSTHKRSGEDYGYGIGAWPYGIFAEPYQDMEIRGHNGGATGWESSLLWAPEKQLAVAVLINKDDDENMAHIAAYCALQAVLQSEPQEEPDYTTDPSTWKRYRGLYLVRNTPGDLTPAYVELVDNQLLLAELNTDNFEVKVFPLEQAYLDTFLVEQKQNITFIETSEKSGKPTLWLRNRLFVGPRIDQSDPWWTSDIDLPDFVFQESFWLEAIQRFLDGTE